MITLPTVISVLLVVAFFAASIYKLYRFFSNYSKLTPEPEPDDLKSRREMFWSVLGNLEARYQDDGHLPGDILWSVLNYSADLLGYRLELPDNTGGFRVYEDGELIHRGAVTSVTIVDSRPEAAI